MKGGNLCLHLTYSSAGKDVFARENFEEQKCDCLKEVNSNTF